MTGANAFASLLSVSMHHAGNSFGGKYGVSLLGDIIIGTVFRQPRNLLLEN